MACRLVGAKPLPEPMLLNLVILSFLASLMLCSSQPDFVFPPGYKSGFTELTTRDMSIDDNPY